MFTIGSVGSNSDFQSEIERVLSIPDKKTRDISIAFLIKQAEQHYEKARPFDQSDIYRVSLEGLLEKFKNSFLKAYFKMQFFYWNIDCNAPSTPVRKYECYHRIIENPLSPETITGLTPLLNNSKERNDESRVEIYTNILFSLLGNGNAKGIQDHLTIYNEYVAPYLLNIFLSVAAASPKAIKVNLEYVCLLVPRHNLDVFVDHCLDHFNVVGLLEINEFVKSMKKHNCTDYIQYELNRRLGNTAKLV